MVVIIALANHLTNQSVGQPSFDVGERYTCEGKTIVKENEMHYTFMSTSVIQVGKTKFPQNKVDSCCSLR